MNKKTSYSKRAIYCLLVLLNPVVSQAQQQTEQQYPEVGKPCPDFQLTDVRYYKKKQVTLADFKGKWLILDFWHRHCSYCVASQPHIDSLQKIFDNQAQFLLVGYTGSQFGNQSDHDAIQTLYEKNRRAHNLSLSIAYDSLLFQRFDIKPTPYIIIVDPKGVVQGITYKISEANLNDMIKDNPVELQPAYRLTQARENRARKDGSK